MFILLKKHQHYSSVKYRKYSNLTFFFEVHRTHQYLFSHSLKFGRTQPYYFSFFFFKENHRLGTMERTRYSTAPRQPHTCCSSSVKILQHYTNLNCCHLLTNTPLLYPYSLSNQNQTDPYIHCLLTGGSGGSRTLVFNPFLILSTSCALRE